MNTRSPTAFLSGHKVQLRTFTAQDRERRDTFLRWRNDPAILQYLNITGFTTGKEIDTWLDERIDGEKSRTSFIIEAIDDDSPQLIGTMKLFNVCERDKTAFFVIIIGEAEYHGDGYGTEAVMLLLHHAFMDRDFHKMKLYVTGPNVRAQDCYLKCGFKEVGRLREETVQYGDRHDLVIMEVLQEEWRKVWKRYRRQHNITTPRGVTQSR